MTRRSASNATLNGACGVAIGRAGTLFIADAGSNRIRIVPRQASRLYGRAMTAGDLYTVAGAGRR
ncbi:MAG TPA: hypothetical protein VGM14_16705 [Streptosporangiaceae bacterium]